MSDQHKPEVVSSGVDALIARLRDEGVTEGKETAARLIAEAEEKARSIVESAEAEARHHLEAAQKEAESLKQAGEDALKVAMRDMVLDLKAGLMRRFSDDVRRLVREQVLDRAFLQRLILEVVGRVGDGVEIPEDEAVEVILPREVIGLEDLRRRPEELSHGELSSFIFGIEGKLLRDGVSFAAVDRPGGGLHIRLVDKDIDIDLSDEAIAGLLLEHLQPRFRAIMEGVVK